MVDEKNGTVRYVQDDGRIDQEDRKERKSWLAFLYFVLRQIHI